MAKQNTTAAPVRGAKTEAIRKLALRPQGVSGKEIMQATGWKSGSAAWRVGVLAERLGVEFGYAVRDDRQVGYFLIPAKSAKRSSKAA